MAYEYLEIHTDGEPLYRQLYDSLKKAMETGQLRQGSRLPSIRRLSEDLGVSRTTVEAAYQQLCVEGYLKSEPKRGYFVLFGERMVGTQYLGMAVVIAGALGILLEQKQPQKK